MCFKPKMVKRVSRGKEKKEERMEQGRKGKHNWGVKGGK